MSVAVVSAALLVLTITSKEEIDLQHKLTITVLREIGFTLQQRRCFLQLYTTTQGT